MFYKKFIYILVILIVICFLGVKGYENEEIESDFSTPESRISDWIKNFTKTNPNSMNYQEQSPRVTYPIEGYPNRMDTITIRGKNFGRNSSDLVIYISITPCINVEIINEDVELSCKLMNNNYFQSLIVNSQDVYIVRNLTYLGISRNMFLYRDVVKCPGLLTCNALGNCSFGVCVCKQPNSENALPMNPTLDPLSSYYISPDGSSIIANEDGPKYYLGPTCNLAPVKQLQVKYNTTLPSIEYIYSEKLSWFINFTQILVFDDKKNSFMLLHGLQDEHWDTTSNSNGEMFYRLRKDDIHIDIHINQLNGRATNSVLNFAGVETSYVDNMVQFSITLSKNRIFAKHRISFTVTTHYIPDSECDYSEFFVDIGKGYNRNDVRWISIRKFNTSLYSRLYSRCLADGLPQRCTYDVNEDPVAQSRGEMEMFINFEPWHSEITLKPDFMILSYENKFLTKPQMCLEKVPKQSVTQWLLPTLLPVVVLGLSCLTVVIFNLFKVNKKSFEFEDETSSSSLSMGDDFNLDDQNISGIFDSNPQDQVQNDLDNSDIEDSSDEFEEIEDMDNKQFGNDADNN